MAPVRCANGFLISAAVLLGVVLWSSLAYMLVTFGEKLLTMT